MFETDKVNYLILHSYDKQLLHKAANLHIKHLSYGGFVTLFGYKFIEELYKDMLSVNLGFFIFAIYEEDICGFIIGCMDSDKLFKIVICSFMKYAKIIIPTIIRKPELIVKLCETFFYSKKENTKIKAELLVIVTDSNFRSKGIGSKLVASLNQEFLKRNINAYKVTVHDEKKRSNDFYIKNGMKLVSSFNMYNKKWNLYEKKL